MSRLLNRTAIVTGGARGIGKSIVSLFLKEGGNVVIWDVLDEGQDLATELNRIYPNKVYFDKVDIVDYNAVLEATNKAIKTFDKIDILINNAGITRDRTLLKMSPDEWNSVLQVNLTGIFNCSKILAGHMKENGYGRIVSASSISGIYGNYGQTNYAATKAGIIGMTKSMAKELGRYGITVNSLAPGFTETEMTALIPEDIKTQQIKSIPLQRIAQPIEMAYGYLFLASEESSFVNGICLPIDGGFRF